MTMRPCDIYMISSADEGETWSEPVCLARAADFGVSNIMSVSGIHLLDGRLCFFFLIKENDIIRSSSLGRVGPAIRLSALPRISSLLFDL